ARSNSDIPTTIGTRATPTGKPRPRSSSHATAPVPASSPNADPPLRTTASTCWTIRSGSSSANSRVAGAPPRTSPDATVPSGRTTTVHPVRATGSVQWPTRMPGTSVSTTSAVPAALDAGADAAHDLVGDRAERRGPVGRTDALAALLADEHDVVAHLDVVVAAVDHQLVHRDRADDRVASAADEHLAAHGRQVAAHAVGVAD